LNKTDFKDLISYEVVTTTPSFAVAECTMGSGAACGSILLNQRFEWILRKRFERKADSILTPKRVAELVRHFDSSIKRDYNPLEPDADTEYEVPIVGVPDMPDIGLEDGYLRLSEFFSFEMTLTIEGRLEGDF
jgi:hypothetical protein